MTCPYKTFELIGLDHDSFLRQYSSLQQQAQVCKQCIDAEFTTPILQYIKCCKDEIDHDGVPVRDKVTYLQGLLTHTATFAPISSDLVECLHGYCQRLIRQSGGGSRPSDSAAQQRVLWAIITKTYRKIKEFMWHRFGDKRCFSRLAQFGHKGSNQYSKGHGAGDDEGHRCQPPVRKSQKQALSLHKVDQLISQGSEIPKPRKLCGIFAGHCQNFKDVLKFVLFVF